MINTVVHAEIHVFYEHLLVLNGQNGIDEGIRNLEWHFSKSSFCNDISPTGEMESGIDPINPKIMDIFPNQVDRITIIFY